MKYEKRQIKEKKFYSSENNSGRILWLIERNERYINTFDNPPERLLLYAIKCHGIKVTKFFRKHTTKIQEMMMEDSFANFKYIIDPKEHIIEMALNDNPLRIKFLENPSEEQQLKAIKYNPYGYYLINKKVVTERATFEATLQGIDTNISPDELNAFNILIHHDSRIKEILNVF